MVGIDILAVWFDRVNYLSGFLDLYTFHIVELSASHVGPAMFNSGKIRRCYESPRKICACKVCPCEVRFRNFYSAQICLRKIALRDIGSRQAHVLQISA